MKKHPHAKRDWRAFLTPNEADMIQTFDSAIAGQHIKASDFARHKDAIRRRCMRRARDKEKGVTYAPD